MSLALRLAVSMTSAWQGGVCVESCSRITMLVIRDRPGGREGKEGYILSSGVMYERGKNKFR